VTFQKDNAERGGEILQLKETINRWWTNSMLLVAE
jgi:hypothetical protein